MSSQSFGISADIWYAFRYRGGIRGMYGTLEEENPGGSTINTTVADTYYGWTTGTTYLLRGGMTADFTGAADGLEVGGFVSDWLVLGSVSFRGTPNVTVSCGIFVDDVQEHVAFRRKLGAGGDVGAAPITVPLKDVAANAKVDIRFASSANSSTVVVENLHFTVARIYP
jgi:hypothetical protein